METAEINPLPQSFVLFTFQIPLEQLHLSYQKPYAHDAGPCSKQILHFLSQASLHICLLTRNSWKWWIYTESVCLHVCVCVMEIKRSVIERERSNSVDEKMPTRIYCILNIYIFFSFFLISECRLESTRFPKRCRVISKRLPTSCR